MPKAIGGYFELELRTGQSLYPHAAAFNAARWAFRALVQARGLRRVHLPYYLCGVLVEALEGLNVSVQAYGLDARLEIATPVNLKTDEALLFVNYFGLKSPYIDQDLTQRYGQQLIIDNSQALFCEAPPGIPTLYSPRKFVGVADGGWLVNAPGNLEPPRPGQSRHRFTALLGRLEQAPDEHYAAYQACEASLGDAGIEAMSDSTRRVLDSIDYPDIARRRIDNLALLRQRLDGLNRFTAWPAHNPPALCYPLLLDSPQQAAGLRRHLLMQTIYVPCYWREVIDSPTAPPFERHLAECLLPLPLDQRYDCEAMQRLAEAVIQYERTS